MLEALFINASLQLWNDFDVQYVAYNVQSVKHNPFSLFFFPTHNNIAECKWANSFV